MTTSSSTSSFPSLMSSMSCRKSQEKCAKKRKTNWGWQLSSWQMFFLGGGKCPNLGVVNVRILGVVNVLLASVFFGGWEMSEFGGGKCPNFGGGKCPPGKCFFWGVGNVRIWGW